MTINEPIHKSVDARNDIYIYIYINNNNDNNDAVLLSDVDN